MKGCPLFTYILVLIYTSGVLSQSVNITEDTVYIKNNVVGQVTCTLTGNCDAIAWYLSSSTVTVAATFIASSCQNTTSGFYQTCDYQKNQYTLYFTGTTALHGQTIRCSGQFCNPQESVSDTVIISIIVPVPSVGLVGVGGQPQITVTAGQSTSITCSTGASRPAPNIEWYIGVTNVTSWSTSTINSAQQQLFYTTSILTFIPTKSQNGQQLNCKAYNTDNNMVELTTKPTLYIQYPPVDANAIIRQGDTISTVENSPVTLVCEIRGGNPLATLTWDCFGLSGTSSVNGDTSRSTVNFIANRNHNRGICTCRATHPAAALGSDSVTINVDYGPGSISYLPATTSYTKNEGESLGPIQCVTDCNPKCSFVWTRPGQSNHNGENLTINGVTRTQEGNYQCTASNSHGSKTGSLIPVTVNYIDPIMLTPTTYSYIVNETYQLGPIKCSATCKPPCSYKWTRPNQNDLQGDTLTINAIQRTQTGVYKCQATNTVGTRNSNDVSVTVHYSAKMTNMSISGGHNFTVNEHSTQTITCLAEGLPQPTISLRYIFNNSIIKSTNGLRLDFTFPSARCEDTGIYKCDAINKFTPRPPLQKDVIVLCKPRAVQEPLKNQYAFSAGGTLNITVLYLAYPRPSFQWFINGSEGTLTEITNDQQDIHINNTAVNTYTFVTEFIRQNLMEDGFGTYILKSRNIVGTKEYTYIVKRIGKPDRPIGGVATCIGYNSAVITWISGFNNGNEQTFTVIYQELGGTEQTAVSGIKDPGLQKLMSRTIASLQESKTYIFRIFSQNSFGESSRVEVNCSTSVNLNREISFNTGVAVGAALGSVIVLMIVVVVVIFIFRRHKRTSLKANKYTKDKEDIQMNDSNQTEEREYEKLGTSNETNVYNVIVSEDAYENPSVPEDKQFDYEKLQTPNDQQTYEQITMKDKPAAVDRNVYVNTAIS